MKKNGFLGFRVLAALAFVLVFGFVVVGCTTDSSPNTNVPKTVKITGITLSVGTDSSKQTNGEGSVFIYTKPEFGHGSEAGLIAREIYHEPRITNGELLVDLYVCDDGFDASDKRWTGSGEYYICLTFATHNGWYDEGGGVIRYWWTNGGDTKIKYNIQDAVTELEFSQFKQ